MWAQSTGRDDETARMPEVDRVRTVRPGTPLGSHNSIVYTVDDDTRVCEASGELFTSLDLPSVTFGSVDGLRDQLR